VCTNNKRLQQKQKSNRKFWHFYTWLLAKRATRNPPNIPPPLSHTQPIFHTFPTPPTFSHPLFGCLMEPGAVLCFEKSSTHKCCSLFLLPWLFYMSLCLGNGSIWANVIVTYDIHNRLWQQVQSCAWKDVKVGRTNSSFGFKWSLIWGKLTLEYVYLN